MHFLFRFLSHNIAFIGSLLLAFGVILPLVKRISNTSSRTSFAMALNQQQCICYLNSVEKGGETSFDKLEFAVAPVQGSALIFFPTIPGKSLDADERINHESLPSDEEKSIIQMFGRVGPRVPYPLGLPDIYDNYNIND